MPLQKSYSDHAAYAAKHHQNNGWKRSNSHSNTTTRQSSNHPPPLQPVSELTRNKLNQFQFRPPAVEDIENLPVLVETVGTLEHSAVDGAPPPKSLEKGCKIAPIPITRLDWRDLIEPSGPLEPEGRVSPNDRITWENPQAFLYAATVSPSMKLRKGRKRARSSSPTSSPANDNTVPTVNVKKLTEALKSPCPDPTLELWDRFSVHGLGDAASPLGILGPANIALTKLIDSCSPRQGKSTIPLSCRGDLRRAISCGLNWPKRRKVELDDKLVAVNGSNARAVADSPKTSLVTALLDTVTSSMQRTSPVAYSPSPKQRWHKNHTSQTRRGSPTPRLEDKKLHTGRVEGDQDVQDQECQRRDLEAESDFGADDLDDDTFLDIDMSFASEQAPATAGNMDDEAQPSTQSKVHAGSNCAPQDEFDDLDDDDVFSAARDIVTNIEHDSQPGTAKLPFTITRPPTRPPVAEKDCGGGENFDDLFGDEDDDELNNLLGTAELPMSQLVSPARGPLAPTSQKPKTIQRYLVTNVLESTYNDARGTARLEKILIVKDEESDLLRTVHLRDDWFETPVRPNFYVHIVGSFTANTCVVDETHNILILHPDQLISATVVADSFSCMRRAVLQDRVKAASESSAPLVYGTMLHEIFQRALTANRWDKPFLSLVIGEVAQSHIEDLYTIKIAVSAAQEYLQSKMGELISWASTFVSAEPQVDAVVQDRTGKVNLCVNKLLDVEEHVWSPTYGLKGNIDATVQVTVADGNSNRTLTVPFEVKTGKHVNTSHMAQTALYTLLLSDRYDIDVTFGILYYMENSQTIRVPAIRHELLHMVLQRNRLACHIIERSARLPPMKRSKGMCGKCYAKTSCFIYHKLADSGDGESSGMGDKFDEVVHHLTPAHQSFFLKWEDLLTKEEKVSQRWKRELWTMISKDREQVGRCFADVVIDDGSVAEDDDVSKINRYRYTFVKEHPSSAFSFLESQLVTGEPVVVSDEEGHFALALGFVTSVSRKRICVAVDRRLHNSRIRQPDFDETNNQVFAGLMTVNHNLELGHKSQPSIQAPDRPTRYRLDKDEFSNGMATVRNNLVQVMADGEARSTKIRQLVVDLAPPTFKNTSTQYLIANPESLNVDQHKAIAKVMSASDYALVLGMPGTGKTFTVAHIIRALVSQGKSVLLAAYTHTAVDNILLKLEADEIPILRLGSATKIHPKVMQFVTLASQRMSSFDQIQDAWMNTPVVATTCLGVGHALFNGRTFDYCIVDEASQITLPVCLGPIRMARTFVLVGDHNQLPPLVRDEEARKGGLDVSLFKLLSDAHPDSVVNLEHQYRMCEDIMTLSSTLVYGGRLRCGTEEIRTRALHIPHMEALRHHHYSAESLHRTSLPNAICPGLGGCWLRHLLDSKTRASFVNTETLEHRAREEAKGPLIVNPIEARIVVQLVKSLVAVGVPEADVGVMTPYRSQLSLLRYSLRRWRGVEVDTADRFQGRDKEVVLVSLVRSNEGGNIGDLLRDWRRINVTFTRAKSKLLVIGSRSTLAGCADDDGMLARFVRLMESRAWAFDLPRHALDSHLFDDAQTQATASAARHTPTRAPRSSDIFPSSPIKPRLSPTKVHDNDKENQRAHQSPKKSRISDRVLMKAKGQTILRDVMNEMTNGAFM